jgi:hypothetical protein
MGNYWGDFLLNRPHKNPEDFCADNKTNHIMRYTYRIFMIFALIESNERELSIGAKIIKFRCV